MRLSADELRAAHERAEAILTETLEEELHAHAEVADAGSQERRWFVRMTGADKEFTTIWFELGERTLHHETGFMPHPEENAVELFRYLLKLNRKLVGVQFAIGGEDAIFLVGAMPIDHVSEHEIDRIVGTIYATVERHWLTAMRIGFGSRFGR